MSAGDIADVDLQAKTYFFLSQIPSDIVSFKYKLDSSELLKRFRKNTLQIIVSSNPQRIGTTDRCCQCWNWIII